MHPSRVQEGSSKAWFWRDSKLMAVSDTRENMTNRELWKVRNTSGADDSLISAVRKLAGKELPEELVERIISRIPFPFLFKARLLSRSWYFKFPLAPQSIRSLSPSVQTLVSSVSPNWTTYCPVYVSPAAILGFDRASNRWQTLMTLSHLPLTTWSSVTSGGPLICAVRFYKNIIARSLGVVITNVLTKSWRKLHFQLSRGEPAHVKITLKGSDAYEVLMVFQNRHSLTAYAEVYDSKRKTLQVSPAVDIGSYAEHPASAFLNGKLYCICDDHTIFKTKSVWVYAVKENAWTCSTSTFHGIADCGVLLCGDKVMLAICPLTDESALDHCLFTPAYSVNIYELDVLTLKVKQVSRGPPEAMVGVGLRKGAINFASDRNFIYFGQTMPGISVLTYNIHSAKWDCLPPPCYKMGLPLTNNWMTESFQPGLCPFMMV